MQRHIPVVGVRFLVLEIRGWSGLRDAPHGGVRALKVIICHVVLFHDADVADHLAAFGGAGDRIGADLRGGDGGKVCRFIPCHRDGFFASVVIDGSDGFRQDDLVVPLYRYINRLDAVDFPWDVGAGADISEGFQGFQRVSLRVEQRLIVAGTAAVIEAGIVGVVVRSVGACPSGAVGFPEGTLFCLRLTGDGDPCRLPVKYADGAAAQIGHGLDHVGQLPRLPLHGEGVGLFIGQLLSDAVAAAVGILNGIGIGGLRDHDLFAAAVYDRLKLRFQIFQRTVPEGIVGGGEHVIVHAVHIQRRGIMPIFLRLRVGVVDGDQDIGVRVPDGFCRGRHQRVLSGHGSFSAEAVRRLVAHLNHADGHARILNFPDALHGVIVNGLLLFFQRQRLPRFGSLLLGGIRPEVGVMEIHQQPHVILGSPFPDLDGRVHRTVAAAVSIPRRVKGVVPDADTDVIDARFMEDFQKILRLSVKIVVNHSAGLLGQQRRYVCAHNEIPGKVFHFGNQNGRLLLCPAGVQRQHKAQEHDEQTSLFHSKRSLVTQ